MTTQNATKNVYTQRLRTDLGRSYGVTTAIQLVWLYRFPVTQPTVHLFCASNPIMSKIFFHFENRVFFLSLTARLSPYK